MRINRFIAAATGLSRRQADRLITSSKVFINDLPARLTDHVTATDKVTLNKERLFLPLEATTIMLNKPAGYVTSREGQGSQTIYDLLPAEYHSLKPVGRLDKDSSGLLLLTDDGQLAHELTHPKFLKEKVYVLELNKSITGKDFDAITKTGVAIGDRTKSKFRLEVATPDHLAGRGHALHDSCFMPDTTRWLATLKEGRNRQIRRTFAALGYTVKSLHRLTFGEYRLDDIKPGKYRKISQ